MKILSGTSNLKLEDISRIKLNINTNRRFADGEIYIEINENIRVTVSLLSNHINPASNNIMELLLVIDALKRSSAKTITAVIPYLVMRDRIEKLLLELLYQQK